jgi:hypothetical protein
MTTAPGRTSRRIALAAAVIGALLVAACLLASTWSQFVTTPVPRDWAGEPLHLTTDRQTQRCLIDPREGPPRSVTVPARPPRSALKIVGTRIEPWFPGNATITCTGPAQATSGPVLALYPLSEREPWVILPGAVLLGAGWVYSRPRRSR